MADLFLLGRLIFGGYFLYNGVNHYISTPTMAHYAASKGVPMPEAAVLLAGSLLIFGGISLLLGVLPRLGIACVVLFLVVVTPTMHNFWAASDPQLQQMEMGNFLKNLALVGGSLMMLVIPTPWPFSVEGMRRRIAV